MDNETKIALGLLFLVLALAFFAAAICYAQSLPLGQIVYQLLALGVLFICLFAIFIAWAVWSVAKELKALRAQLSSSRAR